MRYKILVMMALLMLSGLPSREQTYKISDTLRPFVEFLNQPQLSPKEYLKKSFKDKDIVILSERHHRDITQYEMIVDFLKDFKGDIYTEVGCYNSAEAINQFLNKENLNEREIDIQILELIRYFDWASLWPCNNYYYLIRSIYDINQKRQSNEKIALHPLDHVFNWDSIKSGDQLSMFYEFQEPQDFPPLIERNVIMARHFIRAYDNAKWQNHLKQKALVIENTYHAYPRLPVKKIHPTEPLISTTGEYIFQTYPSTTKCIMINFYPTSSVPKLVAGGLWDAAFSVTGNKDCGFDLAGTAFGKTEFDMYRFGGNYKEKAKFEDIVDGFIFYKPLEQFVLAEGFPGIFDDKAFVEEFYRRWALENNITVEVTKSSKEVKDYIRDKNSLQKSSLPDLQSLLEIRNNWLK